MQDAAEYAPDDLPDEIVVKVRGRTDFRPHFEWLDEQGIQPDVCLYFTVMVCPSYREAEPGFDKIWVNALGRAHRQSTGMKGRAPPPSRGLPQRAVD